MKIFYKKEVKGDKMFLNFFKKPKKQLPPKRIIVNRQEFLLEQDIPQQCDAGMIMHNCGFDTKANKFKVVFNDVLSTKLYAKMVKEFMLTNKGK